MNYITLDGTSAGTADGLVVRADDSHFESLRVAKFKGNGILFYGDRNTIAASEISDNGANGIWLAPEASENTIGRAMIMIACPMMPDGNFITRNGADGILVRGSANRLINNALVENGRSGAALFGPTLFDTNGGGCNNGPFLDGTLLAAPIITSATVDVTSGTIAGVFWGTPSTEYTLEILSDIASAGCTRGSLQHVETQTIVTDAVGNATFRTPYQPVAESIAVLARNPRGEVSHLSQRVMPVSTGETRSDLEVTMQGPASATPGQLVTYDVRVTNHGPAAMSGVSIDIPFIIGTARVRTSGGQSCRSDGAHEICYGGPLVSGASVTFQHTVRIEASSGSLTLHAMVSQRDSRVVDPDAANNDGRATVTVSTPRRRSTRH
jgi:hypothetical protein